MNNNQTKMSRKRRDAPAGAGREEIEEANIVDLNLPPRAAPGVGVAPGALEALERVPVLENLEGVEAVIGTPAQMEAAMGLSAAQIAVQDQAFAAKMARGRFVKHDREERIAAVAKMDVNR